MYKIENILQNGLQRAILVFFSSIGLAFILSTYVLNLTKKSLEIRSAIILGLTLIFDILFDLLIIIILHGMNKKNNKIGSEILAWIFRSRGTITAIFIYSLLALALLSPFASNDTLPLAGDLPVHFSLIVQAGDAVQEGQFPIRIAPGLYNGWRYPEFQFYSQFPYYIGAYIFRHFFPDNPLIVLKIMIWFSLFIGGMGMCKLSEKISGNHAASLLAGAVYMTSPYLLINIFSRGAFPEVVSQGLLPFVILASYDFYQSKEIRYFFPAVILWFVFATTHNISFIYSGLFIGIYFFIRALIDKRIASLIRLGIVVVFSVLMAMYFLGPILQSDFLIIRGEDFPTYSFSWYTHISTLLSPISMPPEPSRVHPTVNGLNPAVGWPVIFSVVFYICFLFSQFEKKSRVSNNNNGVVLLLLFLLSLFLAWSPFDIWSKLPKALRLMQFNYRFLTQVMWTGSILTSISLVKLFGEAMDARHIFAGLFLIGFSSSSFLISREPSSQKMGELVKIQGIDITNDYLFDQSKLPAENYSGVNLPLLTYENNLAMNRKLALGNIDKTENIYLILDAEKIGKQDVKLVVKVNGKSISNRVINPGELNWIIPFKNIENGKNGFSLEFVPEYENVSTEARIHVNKIRLTGLSPEHTVMPLKPIIKNTIQKGETTISDITVTEDAQVIQLPVLYLPDLFLISVNGAKTGYIPVPDGQLTMIGLKLAQGSYHIEVKFTGQGWANIISITAWLILYVLFFGILVYKQITFQKLST